MSEIPLDARRAVLEKVLSGEVSDEIELERVKRLISKRLGLEKIPGNAEVLATASEEERKKTIPILRRKPVRSISGVSVITVMPRPYPCPKEDPCIYCPGGPESNTPQSYTGEEPASARALELDYDPRAQIEARIRQLRAIGHEVDKVELIVFGGTFLAQPLDYQEEFMHNCIDTISREKSPDLETAKRRAGTAETRTIGITFETRPDWCKREHVHQMLRFGATRVELGVQTVYDDIYELVGREHTVQDVIEATRIAKDSGLGITYHMMPGLPGSDSERDLDAFETIFEDARFRPDMLKIYPCLVMRGTDLYEWWIDGGFDPLGDEEAVELVAKMKERVPRWVRIQRVQRDIPSHLIEAGVQKGNLRDMIQEKLASQGKRCKCIRCREVGHRMRKGIEPREGDINLLIHKYLASDGDEIFLSFEDVRRDIILGYLRMRIPSGHAEHPEMDERTALIRMLYVLGELVPVGESKRPRSLQHEGLGRRLLDEAERIARMDYAKRNMAILSGFGARPYYRRFGYRLKGPYMMKKLD